MSLGASPQKCIILEVHGFRVQARTENVSVIFFCADFSIFSYLKLASDIFGGVHKQCGLSKGRERGCCTTYVIIQFDVGEVCV